jgi:hypothetical protein
MFWMVMSDDMGCSLEVREADSRLVSGGDTARREPAMGAGCTVSPFRSREP